MHITIVAKTPVPGRVKTRLCPPCTPQQAADIARAGVLDTIDAIDRALRTRHGATRTLLLDGNVEPWMPLHWRVVAQRGNGLAARLGNGFEDLGEGIIVGMETPHVASLLPGALRHLREGNDVLGPAEDGGYWAIGLCERTAGHAAKVFDGVEMSTSTTGDDQLRRLRALGGRVALLPEARDLDDYADLCAIAGSGRQGRLGAIARQTVGSVVTDRDE